MTKIIRTVLEKAVQVIVSIFFYIPIVLGILAPMLTLIGIDLYISWSLIGSTFIDWTWGYYIIPSSSLTFILLIELLIFCFGLGIFLVGLITLVKGKVKKVTIVQTGIYKYIRHPQNLGIIFIFLPFALYIPGFHDKGIRMGEIVSWIFFTFVICLYSYYDEWKLMKKYNQKYLEYYEITGLFVPKLRYNKNKSLMEINFYKKFLITSILFLVFFIIFYITVRLNLDLLMFYK